MRNGSGTRFLFGGKSAGLLACVASLHPPLVSRRWFSRAESDWVATVLVRCSGIALVALLDLGDGLARYWCVRAGVIQSVSSNNSLRYSWTTSQSREDLEFYF
jgi:hypothetical protein